MTYRRPSRGSVLAGATLDAAHAASMAMIALLDRRRRGLASANALGATARSPACSRSKLTDVRALVISDTQAGGAGRGPGAPEATLRRVLGIAHPRRSQAHHVPSPPRRVVSPLDSSSSGCGRAPTKPSYAVSVWRRSASLPVRIARTFLVVFGPLTVAIATIPVFGPVSDSDGVAKGLLTISMLWVTCALLLVPALLFNEPPPPESPDTDGRGGSGPPPKPTTPPPSEGGSPLPDADQSRERIRDHRRSRRRLPARRPSVEPEPAPVRD